MNASNVAISGDERKNMTSKEPLIDSECAGCTALGVALRDALALLSAVNSDANNVQLDIMRLRRRYHREAEWSETGMLADAE
jgi:hypothetical protein